ncbi:hypothetical protein T484DRAFT_3318107 [Baffinella frigidus]|nr:hypothetical protein T484DRAFT_3318107 [Cryptophyta sp. CCMP2293]
MTTVVAVITTVAPAVATTAAAEVVTTTFGAVTTTPSPAAAAEKAALSSDFVVKTTLEFPYASVAAFLAESDNILSVVKESTGATKVTILRTSIKTRRAYPASRRLLAASVEAEFAVGVDSAAEATAAAAGLSSESLNAKLKSAGLPVAVVVSAAAVTSSTGEAVVSSGFLVKMVVSMKIARESLDAPMKKRFKAATARASGVVALANIILSLSADSRRAAGDTRIAITLVAATEDEAQDAANNLSGESLNRELKEEGLGSVRVIEDTTIVTSDGSSLEVKRDVSRQWWFWRVVGGSIGVLVLVLACLIAGGYCLWHKGHAKKKKEAAAAAVTAAALIEEDAARKRRALEEEKEAEMEEHIHMHDIPLMAPRPRKTTGPMAYPLSVHVSPKTPEAPEVMGLVYDAERRLWTEPHIYPGNSRPNDVPAIYLENSRAMDVSGELVYDQDWRSPSTDSGLYVSTIGRGLYASIDGALYDADGHAAPPSTEVCQLNNSPPTWLRQS